MKLSEMLEKSAAKILDEGMETVGRSGMTHYAELGPERTRSLLVRLYDVILQSIKTRNVTRIKKYAKGLARERFSSGYDLYEVQTAFNVLEEGIWKRIMKELPARESARALGLVSTVLGAGKDALAQQYVALACEHHSATLSLEALFRGTDGV
jgi:hypothetical protein